MQLITPEQLNAEFYESLEAINHNDLNTVFSKTLAHWKYAEKKDTKQMEFGIVSHAIILNPTEFDKNFIKGLDVAEYPEALVSSNDLKAWLKSRGQKVSGVKAELTQRILDTVAISEEQVFIWDLMLEKHAEENKSKTVISPDVFYKVSLMRESIMQDETMGALLSSGIAEHAIYGKLPICKVENICRPDVITTGGHIINYCTSTDINPEKFGVNAYNYGYLLRAALEWDMFTELYGEPPKAYILLAQEKESPYVWKPYYITGEQLQIGRVQREYAQSLIENAIETDKYSAYGNEVSPLELPTYITKKYEEL